MSERLGSPDKEPEISREEKLALISRARTLAPYSGQPVDRFGSYVTHFRHPDREGFTSIYIPGLSGVKHEGDLFSDNVQIIKRIPEVLDGSTGVMHITSYGIHEISFTTEYITDVRFFDIETGQEIRPPKDLEERIQAAIEEYHTRMEAITVSRLIDLHALLNSLDPDDTIELPEVSST